MVTSSKILRLILALLCCLSLAGRAAAQWSIVEEVSDCCCEDEEDPADCCEDPCDDAMPCHHHCCDQVLPGKAFGEFINQSVMQPLIFEVSRPAGDGWRFGLERPPRLA